MSKFDMYNVASEHFQLVRQFMRQAGQPTPERPTVPDEATRILRARLILEEALETINRGLGVRIRLSEGSIVEQYVRDPRDIDLQHCEFEIAGDVDMVELADGCADVAVVTTGTLVAAGIADRNLQYIVNDSNLRKFGPGGHKDPETGKWIKPPDWQPPNIAYELRRQGWLP